MATWRDIVLVICVLGLLALAVTLRAGRLDRRYRRLIAFACGALVAAAGAAVLVSFHLVFIAKLSLIRGIYWTVVVSLLILATLLAELWGSEGGLPCRLFGVFCLAEWVVSGSPKIQALLAAALCCVFFVLMKEKKSSNSLDAPAKAAAVTVVLIIVALQAMQLANPPRDLSLWTCVALLFTLCVLILSIPGLRKKNTPARTAFTLAGAFVCACLLFPPRTMLVWKTLPLWPARSLPCYQAVLKDIRFKQNYDESVGRIERIVRARVPRDATVIVSPRWATFRLKTLRSSFVTFKDRSGALFYGGFAREWISRMHAIGAYTPGSWTMNDSLDLTRDQLLDLSNRYSGIMLDYIVTTRAYDLPLVGRAGLFRLYRIAPVNRREG